MPATGRPTNPDLTKYWKVCIPATLAGTVELYLFDNIHKKPLYGARSRLITELLEGWVKRQQLLPLAEDFINPDDVEERP